MNRILMIISVFILSNSSGFAKGKIDSIDFYNMLDYVNCRYANACIKVNEKGTINEIKNVLSQYNFDNHISSDSLYSLLNKDSSTIIIAELIKTRKKNLRFYKAENKKSYEIIEYLTNVKDDFKGKVNADLIGKINNELLTEYPDKDRSIRDNVGEYLSIIVDGLQWLIILFLLFLYVKPRLTKRSKKIKEGDFSGKDKEFREFVIKQVLSSDRIANKFNFSETRMFEDKLQNLDRRIGQLQTEISEFKQQKLQSSKTDFNPLLVQHEQKVMLKEDLKPDKQFLTDKSGKTFRRITENSTNCFFEVLEIKNETASFRFSGDAKVAIDNYNAVFDEVCDTEGLLTNARFIQHIANGTVKKVNDKWEVIKPAKIKFKS